MSKARTWQPPKNVLPCMREWHEKNVLRPEHPTRTRWTTENELLSEAAQPPAIHAACYVPVYTPATDRERRACDLLRQSLHRQASGSRFCRDLWWKLDKGLSERQRGYLWLLIEKHRNRHPEIQKILDSWRTDLVAVHENGQDWRPTETVPEDYYAV